MEMTFNEALTIQRAQIAYYRQRIGRKGIKAIRKATIIPLDIEPDKPMFIGDINGLVPRGGCFEMYIRQYRQISIDPTNLALHDAIRRGIA